jgi:hypothetical protein
VWGKTASWRCKTIEGGPHTMWLPRAPTKLNPALHLDILESNLYLFYPFLTEKPLQSPVALSIVREVTPGQQLGWLATEWV